MSETALTPAPLERALTALGVAGRVEVRGRVAVLQVAPETLDALGDAERRRAAVEAARASGFASLAVELTAP